ncbi:MAG: APC family permease [Oscillospiraceae bacterium]|nr:APC family permease [Oscillospiraceae bacterium]MCL2278073.1 APC family permease [Oscillospiraceae bacterium]
MNEKNILKRQHGLFVSVCFVVGFLVGTGVFFLPGRVLYEVGGNVPLGAAAWIIGGLMIAPCVYMFSVFAGKYEKIHGFVDYSEVIVGKKYGYLAGWFFAVMYQPAGYAIIAWITSGFTATVAGMSNTAENYLPFRFFITAFFMVATFFLNYFAPKTPVKLNVATTLARMIPLVLMGTVGVISGLITVEVNGTIDVGATVPGRPLSDPMNLNQSASLFAAISATAFAFNGWQAALAFNSEVKDSKRKFPIALMFGFGLIVIIYVLYFIGVTTASKEGALQMMQGGGANFAGGTHTAFQSVFGQAGGVLVGFMIISGLGILNACCLGMSRAMYSLGRRGLGPIPDRMTELDETTNVPNNSMVMAVGISFLWLFVIFANTNGWFGVFSFSLPDFYNYSFFALLIPIFICFAIREKNIHPVKRFLIPIIAAVCAGFMFTTYWLGSPIHAGVYTITFIVLALIGFVFYRLRSSDD